MATYYARTETTIDHATGTTRVKGVVLGGHITTAESAKSKDHTGRLDALFAHQQARPLDAASQRFLKKGAPHVPEP